MEACASSHHWGRLLQSHGYTVRLIPGQFVKPFVKSNKDDRVNAEVIAEAAMRPGMRFLAVKSQRQQDLQTLHRVRGDVIQQRTVKANQIRGLAAEYGIIASAGLNQLRKAIPEWLEDADNGLSDLFRQILAGLHHALVALDERFKVLTSSIRQVAERDPVAKRLLGLRGVGPLCATAMAIELGDGQQFRRRHDFAAAEYSGSGPPVPRHAGGGAFLGQFSRGNAEILTIFDGASPAQRHLDACFVVPAD